MDVKDTGVSLYVSHTYPERERTKDEDEWKRKENQYTFPTWSKSYAKDRWGHAIVPLPPQRIVVDDSEATILWPLSSGQRSTIGSAAWCDSGPLKGLGPTSRESTSVAGMGPYDSPPPPPLQFCPATSSQSDAKPGVEISSCSDLVAGHMHIQNITNNKLKNTSPRMIWIVWIILKIKENAANLYS